MALPTEIQELADWLQGEQDRLEAIERAIDVRFSNRSLLSLALRAYNLGGDKGTVSSWRARRRRMASSLFVERRRFQRLAFIGDSVLRVRWAELLRLTKKNSPKPWLLNKVLSNQRLASTFDGLGLSDKLTARDGLPENRCLTNRAKASTYEALVGAIYLDWGFAEAIGFAERTLLTEAS